MNRNPIDQWINASEKNKKLYSEEQLILEVTEAIWGALENRNWTKAQLAKALGTSKAYITQLLDGSRNMTLRTLADIAFTIGMKIKVRLCEKDESDQWEFADSVVTGKPPRLFKHIDAANEQWSTLEAA